MARRTGFDESTGQVYTETTAPVHSMVSTVLNRTTGKKENPSTYRHPGPGASSLYDSALRLCIWNVEQFTPEAVVYASLPYAERIYKCLKERGVLTLKAWAMFQAAFPQSEEIDHSYHTNVVAPRGADPDELEPIQNRLKLLPFMVWQFSSLTFLNLRNLRITPTELVDLLKFPNLAALVLEQNIDHSTGPSRDGIGIDDLFMRRWGTAIDEMGAFPKLKLLLFRHFPIYLDDSFKCFSNFPSLILCNVCSQWIHRDVKGMEGGQLISKGRWRYLPTTGKDAPAGNENPQNILRQKDKTIHTRMAMLYDLANSFFPKSEASAPDDPVISITYGDATDRYHPNWHSAWFVRVPTASDELFALPVKRPSEVTEEQVETKKRKMRDGKQKDIGSLLDSFV